MLSPGSLTDVAGLRVGHCTRTDRDTGCTVVLCPQGVVAGVDQRGGSPGTRETDLLKSEKTVDRVHALLLTGGSAFGLDAASGVMRWLDERGHGLEVGPARVPIVPAAVLFDLWHGDVRIRPTADDGYAACESAADAVTAQGRIGAGAGARVGKLYGPAHAVPGGIGMASLRIGRFTVAALMAVNAVGDVIDADGRVLAGPGARRRLLDGDAPPRLVAGMATTIGVVATDAELTKTQANQLAAMGQHGLSRAIDPVTPHDGDTLFALATGAAGRVGDPSALGILAAEVVARAIRNAARAAALPR